MKFEKNYKTNTWWLLIIIIVLLVLFLTIVYSNPYLKIIFFVLDGIWVTIYVTILAFFIAIIIGLIGALGRLSENSFIYAISTFYIEIARGIPLLVQLIWWYFAFPSVVQDLGHAIQNEFLINYRADAIVMAIIGLAFCYGAYISEVFRAGINSIPTDQLEAAESSGATYFQSLRYIILPQAIRAILPVIGNELISLLKDSSLVSVVAVADLTRRGREFMSTNFIPIQTWSMVAFIYLIMTLLGGRMISSIEKKLDN